MAIIYLLLFVFLCCLSNAVVVVHVAMEKYYVLSLKFLEGALRPPTGRPNRTNCFRKHAKSCINKTKLFFILFKKCHWSFVLLDLTKHCIQLYDSLPKLVTSLALDIRCVLCLSFFAS